MKQLIQNYKTGEMKIDEVPMPLAAPGWVLVRNAYSVVSAGTEKSKVDLAKKSMLGKAQARPDLVQQVMDKVRQEGLAATYRKVMSRLDEPIPLGYSSSGFIVEVGGGVPGLTVGDRVACAGAGYANHAEYIVVPRNLCAKVPEGAPLDQAGFATLAAIALHGLRQSGATFGETLAVIGLGLIGQLSVELAAAAGLSVIGIDVDGWKAELAARCGAIKALTGNGQEVVEAVMDLTEGRGVDAVLVTAGTKGNGPVELAAELARDRARISVVGAVGMDLPREPYYRKELAITLSRSYGPGRYDPSYEEGGSDYPIGYVRWTENRNMVHFLELLAGGKIDLTPLISHRFPFAEAPKAYGLLSGEAKEPYVGIVLDYVAGSAAASGAQPRMMVTAAPARRASADEVGLGLIGAGNFARGTILPGLLRLKSIRLVGVATKSGMSAKNTATRFGFSYCAADYREILRDDSIQAVVIATRHNVHAAIAREALAAGKAVFLEKPMATDLPGLRALWETLSRDGRKAFMVGFNRRYSRFARLAKESLGAGQPVTVNIRVNAGRIPGDHWIRSEEGAGRVIGEVCHFIDLAAFLGGGSPIRVFASSSTPGRWADEDVLVQLDLSNGSKAQIAYVTSGHAGLPKERIEVFGSGRAAVIDDFRTLSIYGPAGRKVFRSAQGKGHDAELAAFLACVRSGSDPAPVMESALTTLTTFRILDSISRGGPIPIDSAELITLSEETEPNA